MSNRKTQNSSPLGEAQEQVGNAQSKVTQFEHEHSVALNWKEGLTARLANGDDTVTTTALLEADAEIRRTGDLLAAARKSLTAAERDADKAAAMSNPDVAGIVVKLLQDNAIPFGLYGVPINLGEPPAVDSTTVTPAIFAVQRATSKYDTVTGAGKGSCVLYFYGSQSNGTVLDSTLIVDMLQRAAESAEVGTIDRAGGKSWTHGDIVIRGVNLAMSDLRPDIPTLAGEPVSHWVNALGSLVRVAVEQRPGGFRERGVVMGGGWAQALVSRVRCSVEPPKLTRSAKSSDGLVRREYEVDVTTFSQDLDGDAQRDNLIAAVDGLSGTWVEGVGRVETAGLTKDSAGRTIVHPVGQYNRGRGATARLVLVSRAA